MKNIYKFIPVLLLMALVVLSPDTADAQTGFVPCGDEGEPRCSFCHFVLLGQNIINWLFGLVFVIFGVVAVVAGFGLTTSGGNQTKLDDAKKKLSNAFIGLLIVFSAWLIVDTLLKAVISGGDVGTALGVSGIGMWNEIDCGVATEVTPTAGGAPSAPICSDDAALMSTYNGSPEGIEAPGLRTMINCYRAMVPGNDVNLMLDTTQIYTVDLSHSGCALTNGNTVCGPCSHSANSCHYGRGSGLGAMAVDFNANAFYSEAQLHAALRARESICGGRLEYEGSHTHISMDSC